MPGKRLIAAIICVVLAVSTAYSMPDTLHRTPNGGYSSRIENRGSRIENPSGWSLSDPNSVRGSTELVAGRGEATGNGMVGKLLISILIVAVLGVAAIYISKKFLPKITRGPGRKIHVVETIHLAPNKAVHLLSVGRRQLLVASSKERVDFLADVTGALPNMDVEEGAVI